MQIENPNNEKKPQPKEKAKGIIRRNEEIGDKIQNDSLSSKLEATVNTEEGGLKTANSSAQTVTAAQKYAAVQQLKAISEEKGKDGYSYMETEVGITTLEEDLPKKENTHIGMGAKHIGAEHLSLSQSGDVSKSSKMYAAQRYSRNLKQKPRVKSSPSGISNVINASEAGATEATETSADKGRIGRRVVQKKKKSNISGKVEKNEQLISRVNRDRTISKSAKRKNVNLKRGIQSLKSSSNGVVGAVSPVGITQKFRSLKTRYLGAIKSKIRRNQRITTASDFKSRILTSTGGKIKTSTAQSTRNNQGTRNSPSTQNKKITRQKRIYSVNLDGDLSKVKRLKIPGRKAIRIKRYFRKVGKFSKKTAQVISLIARGAAVPIIPVLKAGKKITSGGVSAIKQAAKNVDWRNTSDTGIESTKFLYRAAADTQTAIGTSRHIATGVQRSIKTGVRTTGRIAKTTSDVVRSIPGKTKQVAHTGRRIRTNAKLAARNVKRIATVYKRAGGKAAAKEVAKLTKKAAETAIKAAIETFKLIVHAVELIVSNLPVICIAIVIILTAVLLMQGIGAVVNSVAGIIDSTLNWIIPKPEQSTTEDISELLSEYSETIEEALQARKDYLLEDASSYLSEDDDFYAVRILGGGGDWITYSGGAGEATVKEILDKVEVDENEFYALLFVKLQKDYNLSDGDSNNDIYEIKFTEDDIKSFLRVYFETSVAKQDGLTCPGKNCHRETCEDISSCTNKGTATVPTFDEDGNQTGTKQVPYCKGHPYCDEEHKKSTVNFVKKDPAAIMTELGFTDEERGRVEIVQQLFAEVIIKDALGEGDDGTDGADDGAGEEVQNAA